MFLTLTTTREPATDLGCLLHKNPSRIQIEELSFDWAHVFYPEAEPNCCTVAVLLEVDPVGLVRGRRGVAGGGGQLEQYVNDRPEDVPLLQARDRTAAKPSGSERAGRNGIKSDEWLQSRRAMTIPRFAFTYVPAPDRSCL
jgi:RNA repair, ligase-Pnkp-associating, region of Hen1